jgi:xanthine/CO dehydrogenase XdhC/CoxF family maturation factor
VMPTAAVPPAFTVAVVGAGPAGMAAATFAADLGLEAVLIDQQPPSTQYGDAARTSPARGNGISCHNPDLIWLPVSDRRCPERPISAVGSTGHCNTALSLSAGVSNPKVFLGRWFRRNAILFK